MKTKIRVQLTLALIVAFALIGAAEAFAATRYVNATAPAGNTTCTSSKPCNTITKAVNIAALSGDTISVAAGTYRENVDFMGKTIALKAAGTQANTIIDGGAAGSVLTFQNQVRNASVTGFTIQNGYAAVGGGINLNNASPTIKSCLFLVNNAASFGGAMGSTGMSSPQIDSCTFIMNTVPGYSGQGGAVYIWGGQPTMHIEFYNCIFGENYAFEGGVIFLGSGPSADLRILQSTFARNVEADWGDIRILAGATRALTVTNSIFYWTPGALNLDAGIATNVSYNDVTIHDSAFYGLNNNWIADPLFVDIMGRNYRLQTGSPCIDSGTNAGLNYDITGARRPQGKGYDRGAYER